VPGTLDAVALTWQVPLNDVNTPVFALSWPEALTDADPSAWAEGQIALAAAV
jgi:hypothetical protein